MIPSETKFPVLYFELTISNCNLQRERLQLCATQWARSTLW